MPDAKGLFPKAIPMSGAVNLCVSPDHTTPLSDAIREAMNIQSVEDLKKIPFEDLSKEGFFPLLERKGNIRYFSDTEIEAIRIIECLKASGLEIKEIKQFFNWVVEGPSSYPDRKRLFEFRKERVDTILEIVEQLDSPYSPGLAPILTIVYAECPEAVEAYMKTIHFASER